MSGFVLDSDIEDRSVPVNSKFINDYMIHANGEFVKVYLMLLYYLSDRSRSLSIESLGDSLEQNEKAVIRALKYWEQMNLLSLKYSEDNDICGVTIKSFVKERTASTVIAATRENAGAQSDMKPDKAVAKKAENKVLAVSINGSTCPDTKPDLKKFSNDEDFAALIVAVQQYTGTTLSKASTESLAYMYDVLGFPMEVIEYIIEICVNEGHKSIRYMEAVARDWYDRGILTLEQAKIEGVVCHKDVYTIMKALGLRGRYPSTDEKASISRWLNDYGFDVNIVAEACKRTINRIHSADFNYVEGILKDWKKNSVKVPEDIKKLDEAYKEEKKLRADANAGQQAETKRMAKGNKFHNFEQRNSDYESMKIDINAY